MKSTVLFVVAGLIGTTVAASAQEAVSSFTALAGRIQPGQRISVTDTTGREVRGALERIAGDELVLKSSELVRFAASDIRVVRARERDSRKNGTLAGLAIGAGMGTAWCIGAIADDSGTVDAGAECSEGFSVFPALGALIGLAVDAVIPGQMAVVYQASVPRQVSRASLIVLPLFLSRTKGLAVRLAF